MTVIYRKCHFMHEAHQTLVAMVDAVDDNDLVALKELVETWEGYEHQRELWPSIFNTSPTDTLVSILISLAIELDHFDCSHFLFTRFQTSEALDVTRTLLLCLNLELSKGVYIIERGQGIKRFVEIASSIYQCDIRRKNIAPDILIESVSVNCLSVLLNTEAMYSPIAKKQFVNELVTPRFLYQNIVPLLSETKIEPLFEKVYLALTKRLFSYNRDSLCLVLFMAARLDDDSQLKQVVINDLNFAFRTVITDSAALSSKEAFVICCLSAIAAKNTCRFPLLPTVAHLYRHTDINNNESNRLSSDNLCLIQSIEHHLPIDKEALRVFFVSSRLRATPLKTMYSLRDYWPRILPYPRVVDYICTLIEDEPPSIESKETNYELAKRTYISLNIDFNSELTRKMPAISVMLSIQRLFQMTHRIEGFQMSGHVPFETLTVAENNPNVPLNTPGDTRLLNTLPLATLLSGSYLINDNLFDLLSEQYDFTEMMSVAAPVIQSKLLSMYANE